MNNTIDLSIWGAILNAGFVVQLTLFLLIVMSIVSWAIIVGKYFELKKIRSANDLLISKIKKNRSIDLLIEDAKEMVDVVPLARVLLAGYRQLTELIEISHSDWVSTLESVEREMYRRIRVELNVMEKHLSWLASVGSVAPFVGLFGTVWGILNSFHKIGAMGSASLAVVAPGISEALVATAVGLFAAIPATLFFNHYVTRIRELEVDMNDWVGEFLFHLKNKGT